MTGVFLIYSIAAFHLRRLGLKCDFVTRSVFAPTAYERVQYEQYVGHAETADLLAKVRIDTRLQPYTYRLINLPKKSALVGYR
jgi:hypothetical protein